MDDRQKAPMTTAPPLGAGCGFKGVEPRGGVVLAGPATVEGCGGGW